MSVNEKAPVSVVIITKNEESRITECLDSVRWAAEIIVVDDESTDATVKICEQKGVKVFRRRMEGEGIHRNFAYAKATQPWVLSVDADERVTPELEQEIRTLIAGKPELNGYAMPRKNFIGNYWARYGGMYPARQCKLFKYGAFKYEEQAEVHPRAFMEGPTGELKADLIHYTYRDFSDAIGKLDRQTTLEAKKWFRENRKIGMFNTLRKSIDRFAKAYFKKKGYKDGVIGLFLAVNSGMYQFLTYLKFREMKNGPAKIPS